MRLLSNLFFSVVTDCILFYRDPDSPQWRVGFAAQLGDAPVWLFPQEFSHHRYVEHEFEPSPSRRSKLAARF